MPDINWGMLTPLSDMSPIKTAQPQAPQPSSGSGGQGGSGGAGDLLSGLTGLMGGLKDFFGPNSVSTANSALGQQLQNTPPQQLAGVLTGQLPMNSQASSHPSMEGSPLAPMQQQMQQSMNQPSQVAGQAQQTSTIPMISQVQAAAEKAFPNDPVRQQLAVAQATQESGLLDKPSELATKNNNLFGMKGAGTAGSVAYHSPEYDSNGQLSHPKSNFAAYKSPEESINAYKNVISQPKYSKVMEAKSFDDAAKAVKDAGYATDPNYVKNLQTVNKQLASNVHTGGTPIDKDLSSSPAYTESMQAYQSMKQQGITKSPIMTVVDFSKPADQKRMSVINTDTNKVLMQTYVAQGSKPGFSNTPESHQSSLGTFKTGEEYTGHAGDSMRIQGLDKGVNDAAFARNIVVHGANYVGPDKHGTSWGCFAVPNGDVKSLVGLTKNGSIIHAYSPSGKDMTTFAKGLPQDSQQRLKEALSNPSTNSASTTSPQSNTPMSNQLSSASPNKAQYAGKDFIGNSVSPVAYNELPKSSEPAGLLTNTRPFRRDVPIRDLTPEERDQLMKTNGSAG